jgi:hypothetical protein
MGRTACTEPQCLYKGELFLQVELNMYTNIVANSDSEIYKPPPPKKKKKPTGAIYGVYALRPF